VRDPSFIIQRCRLIRNMIKGILFLFTVNQLVVIQLLMRFLEVHSVTARNDLLFLLEDWKRLQGDL
jgi:hypothetical protein